MFKSLITGMTALSLTLASATPVAANGFDREDVGKLLFGLAAIAVLNQAIENRSDRDERTETRDQQRETVNHNNRSWSDLNRPRGNLNSRHARLPRACLRDVETRFGTQRMFARGCLERTYARFDRLPERCAVRVYTRNGPRSGFDPLCLREHGYRPSRRH